MNTDDKKDRLAAALRRNLSRRKAQSRARKADADNSSADKTDAKSDTGRQGGPAQQRDDDNR